MPVRLSSRLAALALLCLPFGASAQAPGAPRPGTTGGPLPEPTDAVAEARGGSTLTPVGAWPYGPTYGVAVADDGAVVSGQGRVLRIRRADAETEELVLPGLIRDVAVRGRVAYVATSHATLAEARGLFVVSLAPGAVAVTGALTGGTVAAIDLDGTTAYLTRFSTALASYTLAVVDVADPAAPTLTGQVQIAGFAPDVAHLGTTVYIAGGTGGLYVVDAATPSAPVFVRAYEAGSYDRGIAVDATSMPARLAVASGDYEVGEGTVTRFSLANPLAPVRTGQYTSPFVIEDVAWTSGSFLSLYASASIMGVIGLDDNLQQATASLGPPANLVFGANRLALSDDGQAVYASDYYYGVVRYDRFLDGAEVTDAGRSFTFSTITDSADPATVYAAAGAYGVARLRAEADGRLAETGRAHDATWNFTRVVAQTEAFLYVADGFSGVHVIDKGTMERVRSLAVGLVELVAVSEDGLQLFVTTSLGVEVYTLANPVDPVFVGFMTSDEVASIASAREAVYVGEASGSNVRVFRRASFGAPFQVQTLPTAGSDVAVALDGGRLYAYGGPTDVSVFDASVPTAPVLLGTVPTSGGAGFDVHRGVVYVAGTTGLHAIDARDPNASVPLASYNAGRPGTLFGVEATDGTVYLAEGSVGVERIAADLAVASEPEAPGIEALVVSPNPTSGRASVTFALAKAGTVSAEVFDALGRRVAVLASGLAAAGPQTLAWDGRDASGHAVASGVYALRVEAGGTVRVRRVTVVR